MGKYLKKFSITFILFFSCLQDLFSIGLYIKKTTDFNKKSHAHEINGPVFCPLEEEK